MRKQRQLKKYNTFLQVASILLTVGSLLLILAAGQIRENVGWETVVQNNTAIYREKTASILDTRPEVKRQIYVLFILGIGVYAFSTFKKIHSEKDSSSAAWLKVYDDRVCGFDGKSESERFELPYKKISRVSEGMYFLAETITIETRGKTYNVPVNGAKEAFRIIDEKLDGQQ